MADENKRDFSQTLSNDKALCQKPIKEYFPNGTLKLSGCQGIYNGTGIQVGLWNKYNQKGELIETTYYHPDEFGKDYKIITQYEKNKIISKKIYNFDDLYEVELKELSNLSKSSSLDCGYEFGISKLVDYFLLSVPNFFFKLKYYF